MTPTRAFPKLAASFLRELPRIVLVALFFFAAFDKVTHFRGFVTAVQSYKLLPDSVGFAAAAFFIMAEFAIAVGLLTRRWRRPACLAAVLLLTTFTVVYMVARPAGVCGCWFTLTLSTGGTYHILQNLVFIGLAVLTWLDSSSPPARAEELSSGSYPRHSTATQEPDDGRLRHAERTDFGGKEVRET